MEILNTTYTLYPPEKAEKIAEDMKKTDPDWIYNVVHDPKGTGYSFIEIFDEDGEFIERM